MTRLAPALALLLLVACGGAPTRAGDQPTRAQCEADLATQPIPHTVEVQRTYMACYLAAMRADPDNTEGWQQGCDCAIGALAMCFGPEGLDAECSIPLEHEACASQPGVATATTSAAANAARCHFPDAWL